MGGDAIPPTVDAETYNGTAWTEVNNLNTGRAYFTGLGVQTSALVTGGTAPPSPTVFASTEIYDGTSWTEVGDLNTARFKLIGTGTSTEGLVFTGDDDSPFRELGSN